MSASTEFPRVGRLRAAMAAGVGEERIPVKALVLSVPQVTKWMSGFNPIIYSKPPTVILMETHMVLLAPAIREDLAREQSWITDIRLYGHWTGRTSFADTLHEGIAEVLEEFGLAGGAIGFENKIGIFTIDPVELRNAMPNAQLIGATADIDLCRMIKDPDEIANTRIAAAIAKKGKIAFMQALARGKSEIAAADDAEAAMKTFQRENYPTVIRSDFGSFEGGKHCGFECWTMSGPRKFLNTAPSTDRVLQRETGSLLIWTVANGMHAELEVTYRMGKVSEVEMKAMRDALDIDTACLFALFKPGTVLEDVYYSAVSIAGQRGYEHFPARVGHTLGYGNHESVSIAPGSKVVMAPGMVITMEYHVQLLPDVAATQFSITVEITDAGFEFITDFPALNELDALAMRPGWWPFPWRWLPVCLMKTS